MHAIPLSDCRAYGYDNAANIAEKYEDTQAKKEQDSVAIFSLCGSHNHNLCGNGAAEGLPKVITYFGTVHAIYTCSALARNDGNY